MLGFPFHRIGSLIQNPIGFIEQLSGNNGLVMILENYELLLPFVVFLIMGQIIRSICFLLNQITAVFLITEQP